MSVNKFILLMFVFGAFGGALLGSMNAFDLTKEVKSDTSLSVIKQITKELIFTYPI